ncbi:hypothetical protein Golob_017135 [Gossypium lobatum]|uniref:DUF4283 domain-containing protein n=1 Tax=Gossypium lobatum TaxID=34289 RepID=A0A7J8M6R9_9ROSI|nr:hypothetical protein [Gossypium lobatum]
MFSSSSVSNVDNTREGDSLSEDSNTKKVRFKESDVIPEYVMDVKKSFVGGVPSTISRREYISSWKRKCQPVVFIMLGWNLGIMTLYKRLYGIWRPSKPFQLMDIENGYFLAKFKSTNDYDNILS